VTQTIAAEREGGWKEYAGGYTDWATYKASLAREAASKAKSEARPVAKAAEAPKAKGDKLSWKEQRELEALPGKISDLEGEQADLSRLLEDPAIYQRDAQAAQKAAERLAAIDDELMQCLERWETLESRIG